MVPASTPPADLRRPIPAPVTLGTRLRHRVSLTLIALAATVPLLLAALPELQAADAAPASASAPGFLRWNRTTHRVDADIRNWSLGQTLERIAEATGWRVFVEPNMQGTVDARFERRPEREALAALLADVNFAVVPSTNRITRLLVFRDDSSKAVVPVKPPAKAEDAAHALGKELVVRLKSGSKAEAEALAKKLGARLVGSIPELNAYRLEFADEESARKARESLATDDSVAAVETNFTLSPPGQVDRFTGNAPAPVNLRARPVTDGNTVVIALLDTGFSAGSTSHSDFLLPTLNVATTQVGASSSAELPHGEAMFETIIQGLALGQTDTSGKPVRVLPVDIYGGRTETSTFDLAQGIMASLDRGADVINLSLSGSSPSPLVEDALKQATSAGAITFAASGNQPTTEATYPAAYPNVVAVTASDRRGQVASYANRGDFVDIIAPGSSVVPAQGDSWLVQGTSVSTAYASGLAAGLLADSGKPATAVVSQMQSRLAFTPPSNGTTTPTKP